MKNLLILSLFVLVSILYFSDASAQTLGMSITATADQGSDTITVTGMTVSDIVDVTFVVKSPSGNNTVATSQVSPDHDGNFTVTFKVGQTWTENGFYEIEAMQAVQQNSLYTLKVKVEVNNGLTEKTFVTESNLDTGIVPNVTRDAGIEIYAEVEMGSTTIEITGFTDRINQDITLTVTAPNGNTVSVVQIASMLNGEFNYVIEITGPLWKQDGFYTVTAQQFSDPQYAASTEVNIKDGTWIPNYSTPTTETNSLCGAGTVYVLETNSCILITSIPNYPENEKDDSLNENINLKNKIIFLEDENSKLQKDNFQLKVENKKIKNNNNILESKIEELNQKLDDVQNIIMEQIKVIMEVLEELKNK